MAAAATLHALGDPSRHAIVELLRNGERPVGELVENLSLSQPTVSKHLRLLKEAGIVEARADAPAPCLPYPPTSHFSSSMRGWRAIAGCGHLHLDRLEEPFRRGRGIDDRGQAAPRRRRGPLCGSSATLADPPQVVWGALTERAQLASWFPCDVEIVGGNWKVGAAILFRFPPEVIDMTLHGQVLAVEEPRLLIFTWGEETLRFDLSAEGTGTLLVLTDELPPGISSPQHSRLGAVPRSAWTVTRPAANPVEGFLRPPMRPSSLRCSGPKKVLPRTTRW